MKRIIKNSVTSSKSADPQSEYEYRKNIYLKRKHEYETLGEDNNNDVLSREEKMNIAKAEMDKVNPKSSNVKASEDDYNPYSFMVGDQLEWSGLYGGQYKGLVTNVNDEYVTVEVMRTAEDSGDTIIDTQKFEIVTDPEGKECIIVWTYGSHAGYVYPPYEGDPDDYIHSADKYNVSDWKELASKSVEDSDGFNTDYTLYTNGQTYICMFGDKDLYEPDASYADYETESEQDAWDWFNSYTGFADEEDEYDVYSSEDIKASMGRYDDYFGQTAAATHGDLIVNNLKGRTVSKRRDLAEQPGGLIYEANALGIDMWDLLEALEGMCREGRAREIDDSTYEILGEHSISKSDVTGSTKLKRIARYGEFDNGHVLHDWTEMTDAQAEDLAKQMSLENPDDVYYVAYDNIMDSSSDTRWVNGQPYSFKDVGIRGGKPYIKNEDIQSSQSYLDRIEELMDQGLDEETASREAYAEFYPDDYDADDYDNIDYSYEDSIYSSDNSKAFTGYVRTICDNCDHSNRVKVTFPEFNKPFEDTEYECENCGAVNKLTDPHVYDEDGYIISSTISSNLDKIRDKLLKAVHDVMTSSEFGFLDDEVEDYSAVEIVPVNDNMICIEVRAEVDYDGLWMLKEVCDPIIQKYYPDAYFDMETAGVMQAYISKDVPIKSASNDTYYMQLKRAYKNMRKFDDMDSQSANILDLEDELNAHNTPYERYEHKTDNGCTIFYDDYIKGQEFNNSDLTERETLYYKGRKFVIHYTVKDTYDVKEAFDSFKASISMIAPYDDADYYWARIYNGMIKYIYKGKVMRVNFYFNPEDMSDVDDWNLEDWYSGICDEVVQSLYEANKSIESKMVHN